MGIEPIAKFACPVGSVIRAMIFVTRDRALALRLASLNKKEAA